LAVHLADGSEVAVGHDDDKASQLRNQKRGRRRGSMIKALGERRRRRRRRRRCIVGGQKAQGAEDGARDND